MGDPLVRLDICVGAHHRAGCAHPGRLIEPREPVRVLPLTPGDEARMIDWATGYLADHPDWEMAGIGNNNQAWARDVLRLAAALYEARKPRVAPEAFVFQGTRHSFHMYTCELCKPSPEWLTQGEYAAHMAAEHGTVTVGR